MTASQRGPAVTPPLPFDGARAFPLDGLLARCLGSRHHDGFVREACLRRILEAPEPWVVPFVVRLAGEYVVEIVQAIEDALPALDQPAYGRFFLDNPRFLDITGRRVTSYYYAYQAAGYLGRGDEPGSRVTAAFRRMRDAAGTPLASAASGNGR